MPSTPTSPKTPRKTALEKVRKPALENLRPNLLGTVRKPTRRRSAASQAQFRDELVARARDIYRSQGYEALTVRALTEAFGMSPMAFYAYFPSKQALVRHIWVDIFREVFDAFLAAGHGTHSPADTLRAHIQANLDYWEAHPDHFRMIYLSQADAPGKEPVEIDSEPLYRQMVDLLHERVVACAGAGLRSEAAARMLTDHLRTKMFGYLFMRIGLPRYALVDAEGLKRKVIDDAMRAVQAAAA